MAGNIVSCSQTTRHFLTVESREGGVVRAVLADLEGNPIRSSGLTFAGDDPAHVEVFLDSLTGEYVAKISHSQAIAARKEGTTVYQGVGEVTGWFVDAPDFTLSGRHGERAGKSKEKVEPDEYGGPGPMEHAQLNGGGTAQAMRIASRGPKPKKKSKEK